MEKDGQSQTELANDRKVKASTNTVTLNRMVKAGLIEKKKDEFDQRITRIYMTAKGRDVVKEVVELKKQLDELCFLEFSEEEKTTLRELLKKMSENIKIDPHEFQPPDMHDLRKNCRH
jgi:DNA-binding MarR family transcriptional regulator